MTSGTDLIVIGSGILGLATAHRAVRRGLSVRVIEESARPVGASIQNFGHACFTGQADELQDLALASRSGWLEASQRTGLWTATTGTVIPAATAAEMRVLEELAAHRGPEQVHLLTADEARAAMTTPALEAIGGALLPLDMRVDPREAAPRLAGRLADHGVGFHWSERVLWTGDGIVVTARGSYHAQRVIACPGTGVSGLFPEIADRHRITQCSLAMALVERPEHLPTHLAVLTGTSLARYDAFTAMPGAAQLRRELEEREPELVACAANLMVTGIDTGLLVGDSHSYHDSPEPFLDADVSALLLEKASQPLDLGRPRVIQRWLGHYSDAPETPLVIEHPDDVTTVAVVTSGIGMTLSFGIAERVLGDWPTVAG